MDILGFDQAEYEKIVEREKREVAEKAEAKGRAEMKEDLLTKAAHAVNEGSLDANGVADLFGVSIEELEAILRKQQR